MKKLDPKFTEALMAWKRQDHSSDEMIRKGAELLLKLNRNHVLYQQILRTPQRMLKKLEYEIDKHVNIRLDGFTLDDLKEVEEAVLPEVGIAVEKPLIRIDDLPAVADSCGDGSTGFVSSRGKRPDHESLPADIKMLWEKNAERWKKIKSTFEFLKTLDAPCDRYEHVKLLKEAWYAYKKDMARYDDFKDTADDGKGDGKPELSDIDKNFIDNAQSYISRNLPVVTELVKESLLPDFSDEDKARLEEKAFALQDRVNTLLRFGVELSDVRKGELLAAGMKLELPEDNAEGERPE